MSTVSNFLKSNELILIHETVRQVSLALSVISRDVVIGAQDGETRPQEAYENVLAVLKDATSNDSINDYITGLAVCVHSDMGKLVKTASFVALSCCLKYKQKISEGNCSKALADALDAREYAGQAMNMAMLTQPLVNRAGEIIRTMEGREHIRKHPHNTKKNAFTDWATKHIKGGATPKNCPEIKRLTGFDPAWGVDDTIKKWWRAIPGAPALRSGAATAAAKK